jgi:biopolymer transport protein ExbB
MSYNNYLLRWSVTGRWVATIGIGLVVALGYVMFRPAHAQAPVPKSSQNPPVSAGKGTVAPAPKADGALLSPQEIDKKASSDVTASEPEKKDAPPVKEADTMSVLRDIKWLSPHMWAFYAIWVVSLIAVSFAVERFLGIRRSKIMPLDLAAGLRSLTSRKGEFDLRHAQRLCRLFPSAAANVVKAMLAKVGRPVPEIEQAMANACEHEATRLYANVRVQNLAFNVAPMLGLAGTVHGMILCFYTTAHMPVGVNKMDQLATGIYAALICTLAGLIVAIPAGILSHYFEGRILKMFHQVEELARSLVPSLERFEGRPRNVAANEKQSAPSIIDMHRDEDDFDDEDDDPLPASKPQEKRR